MKGRYNFMYYKKIKSILAIAMSGDDQLDQDALYKLQYELSSLALEIANKEKKGADLIKSFPYLFKSEI